MPSIPELPVAYDLVTLDRTDSVVDEARRRAALGADEGLLIWAGEQTAAQDHRGRAWPSPAGNLHCAILLRPDYPVRVGAQLAFVSAVGAGAAIAEVAPPMTDLKYRWPNEVLVNGATTALVRLAWDAGDPPVWLVVALYVNVTHYPDAAGLAATSLRAEAIDEATDATLLQAYARHFLAWINRWGDDGFGPIRKAWLQRADGLTRPIRVELASGVLEGRFLDVDPGGSLVIEQRTGSQRLVPIAEAFQRRTDAPPVGQ
jgi:BirA family biotin operon repressor/biotin-[acetyl-CoA-carboxylase] ligase